MRDILINLYPWIKAAHIFSIIAWMAALLYLPRLFVNHVENQDKPEFTSVVIGMEMRLHKIIMNPAMMATWIFGLILIGIPGLIDFSSLYIWIKLAAVLCMTGFHIYLSKQRKALADGTCTTSAKKFRVMNEVPTILLLVIVVMIVVRPV